MAPYGFRVLGSGFEVQGSGFRVLGSGFKVLGSGFEVQGSRLTWAFNEPKAFILDSLAPYSAWGGSVVSKDF